MIKEPGQAFRVMRFGQTAFSVSRRQPLAEAAAAAFATYPGSFRHLSAPRRCTTYAHDWLFPHDDASALFIESSRLQSASTINERRELYITLFSRRAAFPLK